MKKLLVLLSLLTLTVKGASPDLVKGIDLTGLSSITAAQLNQLVDNATVATNRGMVIIQATTPDTATYPKLTNYVWIDTSALPYTLKVFTTNSWVAGSVGANSVLNGNIANGAVTSNKIASLTIVTTNIAANAITYDKIADGNVRAGKYATGSITNTDLAADAVHTANILDQNVTTAKIQDAAITSIKIASGAIYATNLTANSVYGTNIAANTIVQTNITDQGVGLTNIVRGTVGQVMHVNAGATALEYVSGGLVGLQYTNIINLLTNDANDVAWNNTIPSAAQGSQIGSLTITPKYTNSVLRVSAHVNMSINGPNHGAIWLVYNGVTVASTGVSGSGPTYMYTADLDYFVAPNSLTARTYTLRFGGAAGVTLNSQYSAPTFGGTITSSFKIEEIIP